MSNDIEKLVLAVLLHPLRDLVERAWGDKPPDWVKQVYQKIENDYELEQFDQLIKKAVQLAMGREELPERATDPHLPLFSIFSGLILENENPGDSPRQVGYFSPTVLTEAPVYPKVIPIEEISSKSLNKTDYQSLCQNLFTELKQAVENRLYVNNTMVLMRKYCSFIPYETIHVSEQALILPDVPVYGLCKVAAAIASCIYLYEQTQGKISSQQGGINGTSTGKYLFVAGDFSGVQNFIYTISSRGALKTLRARSFFLELLTIHITYRIVREIGLTPLNILYSGGGRFSILAPAGDIVKNTLLRVREDFNRYLADEHGAQLYLVMEWMEKKEELTDNDFSEETKDLYEKLGKLFGKIEGAKRRRFGYLMEFMKLIKPFTPEAEGKRQNIGTWNNECPLCHKGKQHIRVEIETKTRLGSSLTYKVDGCEECLSERKWEEWKQGKYRGECRVCGTEAPFLFSLPEPQREGEEVPVCWLCHNLYHIGEHLPMEERRYLLRTNEYIPSKAIVKIEDWYYYLVEKGRAISLLEDGKAEEAWIINSVEPKDYCWRNSWSIFVGRHQLYHKKNGMPLDFHDLANWSIGASRLGVLRMDVDNMGDIFLHGLLNQKSNKKSSSYFARWATLSQQLDLFFKFYINKICKGVVKERVFTVSGFSPCDVSDEISKGRKVAIVYSGGDDLFIIGAWSDVVELAFDIHRSFKDFTANNPEIDLSGGVVIVDEHSPIHLTAELSKRALKKAKENSEEIIRDGKRNIELEKGSIALFWSDAMKREKKIIEPVFRWRSWRGEGRADWASAEQVVNLVQLFLQFKKNKEITLATPPSERRIILRLPRALIYDLFNLVRLYCKRGKFYLARMTHTLSRREPETHGLSEGEAEKLWELWQYLKCHLMNPFTIRYLLPSATWVELLIRAKPPDSRKER